MANDAKRRRLDCGADTVDRISNLPKNLIHLILKRLPLHDAARTTILSKAWRNIWEMHPHLVFDKLFFSQLVSKKKVQVQPSEVSTTISNILLLHNGPVLKFHLSIPQNLPLLYTDLWIKNLSSRGIRKLELLNRPLIAYKMPSYLFSCLELTHLTLINCILNPPLRFGGFRDLIDVKLAGVKITADMSFGTQLKVLKLNNCTGIEHLGCQFKYHNNLSQLTIIDSGEIDWRWFEYTKKVQILALLLLKESSNYRKEVISLDKLLGNMPKIIRLCLSGFVLKCSEPGAFVMKRLTTMENLNTLVLKSIGFCDLVQIQYALCLIRSSPKLKYLRIWQNPKVNTREGTEPLAASRVEQYLPSPNFVNMILDKLETVEIRDMEGLSSELHFIKLLLVSSPSLRWMKLFKRATIDDPKEELRILGEVTRFPRASTTAQIIWA